MTALSEANQHLKYFGEQLVPMIGYCQPEILKLTDESVEIKIPLNNETKNHLHSMYLALWLLGPMRRVAFWQSVNLSRWVRKYR